MEIYNSLETKASKEFKELLNGQLSKSKNICITGTNGKTTTVSLLTDILSTQKKVLKSGNIGIPFSKIVLENRLYEKNER